MRVPEAGVDAVFDMLRLSPSKRATAAELAPKIFFRGMRRAAGCAGQRGSVGWSNERCWCHYGAQNGGKEESSVWEKIVDEGEDVMKRYYEDPLSQSHSLSMCLCMYVCV